jgi:hypothetical protein
VAAFRPHRDIPDVLRRAHRFQAADRPGLLSLAKDLARVTADSLDAAAIRSGLKGADPKLGSLKSLESLLATQVGVERAREVMRPLFGVYELRLADAHLPKHELDEALEKVGVDEAAPHVMQGYQLLSACVGAIFEIIEIVDGWREEP